MYNQFALLAALAAAVRASPFPQAVTSALSPSAAPPPGCTPNYSGSFGLAVMNISGSSKPMMLKRQVSQINDGQIQAPTAQAISQIKDGQPQAPTYQPPPPPPKITAQAVSQIGDGQIQAHTAQAVSQISDGQIQSQTALAVRKISDGQIHPHTYLAVTQINDGQIQAPKVTMKPISQIGDGQIQAPYVTETLESTIVSAAAATQIKDGQPQAPSVQSMVTSVKTSLVSHPATASASVQAAPSGGSTQPVACGSDSTLTIQLKNGKLTDNQGRTGYIASNYQFQFDKPAQAGAIYTSGWGVCGNGTLSLGGQTTFYQCLSGDFYNLYDRDFGAGQCKPVELAAVDLKDC